MLKTYLSLVPTATVPIIPFKQSDKSVNRISFHYSAFRTCCMYVLYMYGCNTETLWLEILEKGLEH